MPRRAASELASGYSSPLSSAPLTPTDASGEPLPVPATLGTHIIGSRLLRSASRSSRGSHSSSTLTSRSSSRARQIDSIEPSSQAGSSSGGVDGLLIRIGPLTGDVSDDPEDTGWRGIRDASTEAVRGHGQRRRRTYSIRDEMNDEQEASIQSSSSSASEAYTPESSRSPPKRKRRAPSSKKGKGTKRRKVTITRSFAAQAEAGPSTLPSIGTRVTVPESDVEVIQLSSELISKESTVYEVESSSSPVIADTSAAPVAPIVSSEPLAEYSCPICFSPPTNATITPCGHICCGECLFTAVRSSLQRAAPPPFREPNVARCPVCRAVLNGWDGRGGGVIGLRPRTIISL